MLTEFVFGVDIINRSVPFKPETIGFYTRVLYDHIVRMNIPPTSSQRLIEAYLVTEEELAVLHMHMPQLAKLIPYIGQSHPECNLD